VGIGQNQKNLNYRNFGSSVDTANSYEVPHNFYNEALQRSIDHIDKSHEDPHNGRILEDSVFNTRCEHIFLKLFSEKSTSLTIMTIDRVSTLRRVLRGSLRQVGCFIKITTDLVPKNPYRPTVVRSRWAENVRRIINKIRFEIRTLHSWWELLNGLIIERLRIKDDWDLRRTIIAIVSNVPTQLTTPGCFVCVGKVGRGRGRWWVVTGSSRFGGSGAVNGGGKKVSGVNSRSFKRGGDDRVSSLGTFTKLVPGFVKD
nr:hypothetical protein [Tanacetum cinerariifolium]